MKKVWKWVIGIVLVLVVLTGLVGVGFLLRSNFHMVRGQVFDQDGYSQPRPGMMPNGGFGPHMRGFGGMMPFAGIVQGLFSLGFLALAVMGVVWLVDRLRTPKHMEMPAASVPAVVPAAVVHPCKKCGQPLQDDWKVCPHCGKKV